MAKVNQIRKDVDTIRKHTQTPLKEPEWKQRSKEITASLKRMGELRKQLTIEEQREAALEVVEEYADKHNKERWKNCPASKE